MIYKSNLINKQNKMGNIEDLLERKGIKGKKFNSKRLKRSRNKKTSEHIIFNILKVRI